MTQRLTSLVIVGVLFAMVGCQTQNARENVPYPLDGYPGFGRSERALTRDDSIAFWESYRRERLVFHCMEAKHGFYYWPQTTSPPDHVRSIAAYLGVTAGLDVAAHGQERNAKYVAGLDKKNANRYALALWGEVSLDGHTTQPPEVVGESRKEFPSGGCAGLAQRRIPGVWAVQRRLEADRERANPAGASTMKRTERAYRSCTVQTSGIAFDSPAEAEDVVGFAQNDDPAKHSAIKALNECADVWAAGHRAVAWEAERRFLERNRDALEALRTSYSDLRTRLRADRDFIEFIRREAARGT